MVQDALDGLYALWQLIWMYPWGRTLFIVAVLGVIFGWWFE